MNSLPHKSVYVKFSLAHDCMEASTVDVFIFCRFQLELFRCSFAVGSDLNCSGVHLL